MGLLSRYEDGGLSKAAEVAFVAIPTVVSLGVIAVLKAGRSIQQNFDVFRAHASQPGSDVVETSSSTQPVAGFPDYN